MGRFFRWLASPFIKVSELGPNVITGIAAVAILLGGTAIIADPSQWWVVLSVAAAVVILVVIAKYGRWILKTGFSLILLCVSVALSYSIGIVFPDPIFVYGWVLSIALMFLCITGFSFLMYSGNSRWTGISLALIVQFFAVFLSLATLVIPPRVSILIGFALGVVAFIAFFKGGFRTRVKRSAMPQGAVFSDKEAQNFAQSLEGQWNVRYVPKTRRLGGYYVVWDDIHAFTVYPIVMTRKFGHSLTGDLMFNEEKIAPWLLRLYHKTNIAWKTRGADTVAVLLDVKQGNGSQVKYIGVPLPDSNKSGLVAIAPGLSAFNKKSSQVSSVFNTISTDLADTLRPLSEKQKSRLEKTGIDVKELE